jgi:hypothetical protein
MSSLSEELVGLMLSVCGFIFLMNLLYFVCIGYGDTGTLRSSRRLSIMLSGLAWGDNVNDIGSLTADASDVVG